jgi:sortase A
MKEKRFQLFLSIFIMVIGVLLIAYPKSLEWYRDYQQQKLVKNWEQSLLLINDSDGYGEEQTYLKNSINSNFNKNRKTEEVLSTPDNKGVKEEVQVELQEEEKSDNVITTAHIEGMIKIEKINLNLPILEGATEENMKLSVASIYGTGKAGQIGNYSIAGHRSRTYGRNFNRLDEVEIGDRIEIDNGGAQYTYIVKEKLYVSPDDVWVLNSNVKDREITLITCHPMVNPTQRLIIKGIIE